MVKDRFCLILPFCHLGNNEEQPSQDSLTHDPIFKLIPFVDKLVTNFQNTFHPGKTIAIDEAMVAWRSPASFRIYNPDKPYKFGIKVLELCERYSLLLQPGVLHCRREVLLHGVTFNVVTRLISP